MQGKKVQYINKLVHIDNAWDEMGRDSISFELIGREENKGANR